ncbi:MAG: hypothetical protein JSS63_15525 [Bacteroidetes bacterium]|nr:hypothetical protein [Bacteroidota bacterium]
MEKTLNNKTGYFEIIIKGKIGDIELTPQVFDIKEIKSLLEDVEKLIPYEIKERPLITYEIEKGSVINKFKTGLQYVAMLNGLLGIINDNKSIDFLDKSSATVIENFQNKAIQKDFKIEIKTSIENSNILQITNETRFYKSEETWIDSEFYFYGNITNVGGKEKPNIHLTTKDLGTLIVKTPKEILKNFEENVIYKDFGVRATGKQNLISGEIDKSSLVFLDIIEYRPKYDPDYIKKLRDIAKKTWIGKVDADKFLNEQRGRL